MSSPDYITALGQEIHAISQDAPSLQIFADNGFQVVFTGAIRTPELNMGFLGRNGALPTNVITQSIEYARDTSQPLNIFAPKDQVLRDQSLQEQLSKLGLIDSGHSMPHMVREAGTPLSIKSSDQITRQVKSSAELGLVMDLQSSVFGFDRAELGQTMGQRVLDDPRVMTILGYHNDQLVSTVMQVQPEVNTSIAGIWNMVTNPNDQRKGFGSHLLSSVLAQSPDATFHLLATEDGLPMYQRFGFGKREELMILELK